MSNEEALRERVDELEQRLKRIEEIFAPNLLDRQTKHVAARERDAREVLSPGDEKVMRVISPLGHGQEPQKCVGKIHGVVTFVDCDEDDGFEEGEYITVRLVDVAHSSAEGVALQRYEPEDGEGEPAPDDV